MLFLRDLRALRRYSAPLTIVGLLVFGHLFAIGVDVALHSWGV